MRNYQKHSATLCRKCVFLEQDISTKYLAVSLQLLCSGDKRSSEREGEGGRPRISQARDLLSSKTSRHATPNFLFKLIDLGLCKASSQPHLQPWAGWLSHAKFFSVQLVSLGIYASASVLEPGMQMDGT